MIVDTSALYAFYDRRDRNHDQVVRVIMECTASLVVSPLVIAELDYLVLSRLGTNAEIEVLGELSGGAWELPTFGLNDLQRSLEIVRAYRDAKIGITAASNVALAERLGAERIATLDRRHYSFLRLRSGKHLEIVP